MSILQDFTIIDGKVCLGATSFTNKFLLSFVFLMEYRVAPSNASSGAASTDLFGGGLASKACLFCKFLVSFVLQRPINLLPSVRVKKAELSSPAFFHQ